MTHKNIHISDEAASLLRETMDIPGILDKLRQERGNIPGKPGPNQILRKAIDIGLPTVIKQLTSQQ